jgi:hypothetical protein
MTALEELLHAKVSPSAKVLALHLAHTLHDGEDLRPMHPRLEADAVRISRSEYERAYKDCFRAGWVVGPSPTKVAMKADALPRRALAEICASPSVKSEQPLAVPASQELSNEWTRDHSTSSGANVRGRQVQGGRPSRPA